MFSKRTSAWSICILVALYSACSATGATWYVDDDAVAGGDGATWATAFETIQAGIDASTNGDTVLVSDGTYWGEGNWEISFHGKAITVVSKNGPSETIVDCIDTSHKGILFDQNETRDSILDGFTVTRSHGGGIHCTNSSPVIQNCVIYKNYVFRLAEETTSRGIFISGGAPLIRACRIVGNRNEVLYGDAGGGGVVAGNTSAVFENCLIAYNVCIDEDGSRPDIYDSYGGGVRVSGEGSPSFINCTFYNNGASIGSELYAGRNSSVTVRNCIFNRYVEAYDRKDLSIEWSCLHNQSWDGIGNIRADAQLVVIGEGPGLHVLPTAGSPCIDAGDNYAASEVGTIDVLGNPRFVDDPDTIDTGSGTPPIVDMGAYEYQLADVSYCGNDVCNAGETMCSCPYDCGEPPASETQCSDGQDNDCDGVYDSEDPDCALCGDGTCTADETCVSCPVDCCYTGTIYVDDDALPNGDGMSWETAFQTIQEGVTIANDGSEILVADGHYSSGFTLQDKTVSIRSQNGCESTFIEHEPLSFLHADGSSLEGFTIQYYYRVPPYYLSVATLSGVDMEVRNCQFKHMDGVTALSVRGDSSVTMSGCTFYESSEKIGCGGSEIAVDQCQFYREFTVSGSTAVVDRCLFHGGDSVLSISDSDVAVSNCWFQDCSEAINRYMSGDGTLQVVNTLFTNNGTGLHVDGFDLTLVNSTLFNSKINNEEPGATIMNCVIWNENGDPGIVNQAGAGATVAYSCVSGGYDGTGNIDSDPLFIDPVNLNFHLPFASPCVDAGNNATVPWNNLFDPDGAPRIVAARVDMGAYEYVPQNCGNAICDDDETRCSCPDDCGEPPLQEDNCFDGLDDDCDGQVDMNDGDCVCGNGVCSSYETPCNCPEDCGTPPDDESECQDGIDNDCDGFIDREDEDCVLPSDADLDGDVDLHDFAMFQECWGSTTSRCLDPFDFNENGQLDYTDLTIFEALMSGPQDSLCSEDSDCDDGLFCNGPETCQGNICQEGISPCAVGEICLEEPDRCEPRCNEDSDCDDGLFCTGYEYCWEGMCQGSGGSPCPDEVCDEDADQCLPSCYEDSDCDDGVFCNGAESCLSGKCFNGDYPCTWREECLEESDECVLTCDYNSDCNDDGLFCNGYEYCWWGLCRKSANPCASDEICQEGTDECIPTCDEDSDCDDGLFCDGQETCRGIICLEGDTPCAVDEVCLEDKDECVPPCDEDSDCDDGVFCNGSETCQNNICLDGVCPCFVVELCLEESDECVPPCDEDSDCDDGQFCNGPETCNGVLCLEGVNPCDLYDICDEDENQCLPPCDEDSDCDDGLYCNGDEFCLNQVCFEGTSPCGPDEVCLEETDECVPSCFENSDCDDGVFCNGPETCEGHICHEGATPCAVDESCFEGLLQCGPDCNANDILDAEDIISGNSADMNANDVPDECEHVNGLPMLLLASKNNDSVVACNPNSGDGIGYLLSSGFAGLDYPNGFAADEDGNIYISSAGTDSIFLVSGSTGEVIRELSGGGLDGPVEMVLTADSLLVASYSTDSIKEFDLDTGLWVRDAVASGTGGLNGPTGMLRSGQDTILVSSELTNQVLEFNYVTGEFVRIAAEGGTLATPADLLFDLEGNLLVASLSTDSVIRYAPDGTCMGEFIASGSGGLDGPQGMQWLSDDLLLVASRFGNNILKFDSIDGSPLGVFAEPAGLDQPTYVMLYGSGLDAMASIPAGEFQMGDTFAEGNRNELPVHDVHIDGFYIQKHEVTNQQYANALNWALAHELVIVVDRYVYSAGAGTEQLLCMSNGVSNILWDGASFSPLPGRGDHPVVYVTWYGAAAYANWQNLKRSRPLAYSTETWECLFNDGYRLPTEAEWEKAARGGATGTRFPWSDSNLIQHQRANYYSAGDFSYDTSPTENYHPEFVTGFPPYTNPVIYFEANNYSLFGMAGNVSEWCNDYFDVSYYSNSPYENPQGPASGNKKIVRGGSWQNTSFSCRNAVRNSYFLTTTSPYTGFRLVFSFGG